jgi:flagellar hook-length control protein FliK
LAATDAFQAVTEPAIEPAAERGSERAQQVAAQQAPDSKTSGTAARFARALERAAATTAEVASRVAPADGTNSGANGQGSAFGDSSPDHTLPSFATTRHGGPNAVPFTISAPAPIDAPTLAAAAGAAGHAIDVASIDIPERDVVAQLVQSLRMQFRDGIGEAVVKLRPEHLGSVQISITVENGAMKATVQAEMPAVRQWLESNQDTLKNGLADHGLRLERFVVEPDGERAATSDDARQRQEQQRRRHQRRMSEKDHPAFEVTV